MSEERVIEIEFLNEDLQDIRAVADAEQAGEDGVLSVLSAGLVQFRRDEESWDELRDRHDPGAEIDRLELKRRETLAHLISMRSRTIRSEMQMHDLGCRVQELEAAYADMSQRSELLRRSIARLRSRIAHVEEALGRRAPLPETRPPSLGARLVRFLTRRHD